MTIVKNRDAIPLCHPAATKRSGACIHLINGAPAAGVNRNAPAVTRRCCRGIIITTGCSLLFYQGQVDELTARIDMHVVHTSGEPFQEEVHRGSTICHLLFDKGLPELIDHTNERRCTEGLRQLQLHLMGGGVRHKLSFNGAILLSNSQGWRRSFAEIITGERTANLNITEYGFNIACMRKLIGCDADIIARVWEIDRITNSLPNIPVPSSVSPKVVPFFYDTHRANYGTVGSNLVSYANRGTFSSSYYSLMDKSITLKKTHNRGGRGITSSNDYSCIATTCMFNICEYKAISTVAN